jgi:hypothetical protein
MYAIKEIKWIIKKYILLVNKLDWIYLCCI